MLIDEKIKEIAERQAGAIAQAIEREVRESIEAGVKRRVAEQIEQAVAAYFKEKVAPLVRERLEANLDSFAEAALMTGERLAPLLADAAIAAFKKQVESDWSRREVLKALFGLR